MSLVWEDVYSLLEAESERTGMPEAYKTDLTEHDRRRLAENNPPEFVWITRTHGTHLWTMKDFDDCPSLLRVVSDPRALYYHYKDGTLRQVSKLDVVSLYEEHVRERRSAQPAKERGLSAWDWSVW
jgi:hypothetical protein